MIGDSLRIELAVDVQGARKALADAMQCTRGNETVRKAIDLGMQKLAFQAQKERFTGNGPFPVSENRLGVVSGRMRRAIYARAATITADGYEAKIGAAVEYFAAHEFGFNGTVQVPQHQREAYSVNRAARTRTSKKGKEFSVRANQFSVLPGSVRAHARKVNIPARKPMRTAIEQHGARILSAAIKAALKNL